MLIPVEWLKQFAKVEEDPEALADRLTATGNEIEEIRESETGPVFYLKLTPNRSDMLSIRGAGREVAALYECPFEDPEIRAEATGAPEPDVRVDVEASDLCPRYVGRVIRNVKIGPSPDWLRKRLEAVGLRAINNVVDVTNYVMFELGQPLHAFDLDKLTEHRIVVRRARPGEKLKTIDGSDVVLQPDMLVIADAEQPVALAGVMGGEATEVTDQTVNILLEAAYFDPVSVRRTAKRTGVASPSSYRFERGVDPNFVRAAADRAAQLMAELSGGTLSETVIDVYPSPIIPKRIRFRPERSRRMLGIDLSDEQAEQYLRRLGLEVDRSGGDAWTVVAPTYRTDLAIEEDVIEEVGRMYGYDRLPETQPQGTATGSWSPAERLTRKVRETLIGEGLYEAACNTLVSATSLQTLKLDIAPVWPAGETDAATWVTLVNPLSKEFDTLRPSLLQGLIQSAIHNQNRGIRDVYLFEVGYVHRKIEGVPANRLLVSGLLLGSRWSDVWNADKTANADFFAAKGTVEALLKALGTSEPAAERAEHPAFHPGRSAWLSVNDERVGMVGELHPNLAAELDLPRGVYLFELDGEVLLRHAKAEERRYVAPSRFPRALRDVALVVDQSVPSAQIEQILRESMGEFGRSVRLFDVYTGKGVPEGKVSLAYALELGAEDRTLTDEEVDSRIQAARERLKSEVGAEFRA